MIVGRSDRSFLFLRPFLDINKWICYNKFVAGVVEWQTRWS